MGNVKIHTSLTNPQEFKFL